MIRKLFIAITLFCSTAIVAQNEFQEINEIKRSEEYMWEQFSHESADTAAMKACEILLRQLQATDPNLTMDDVKPYIHKIVVQRETITRTFVYIRPADLTQQSPAIAPQQELAGEIMKCSNLIQVYSELLPAAKEDGRVRDFGGMRSVEDISALYIVIFDKEDTHAPLAVLSPERDGQGKRGNLVSHAEENLTDYRGFPAIWFTLPEESPKALPAEAPTTEVETTE